MVESSNNFSTPFLSRPRKTKERSITLEYTKICSKVNLQIKVPFKKWASLLLNPSTYVSAKLTSFQDNNKLDKHLNETQRPI